MSKNNLFRCHALGKLFTKPQKTKTLYFFKEAEISSVKYNKIIDECMATHKYRPLKYLSQKQVVVNDKLSKTTISYLNEFLFAYKYNRVASFGNKYTKKGISEEDAGISLLSHIHGKFYKKNTQRFEDGTLTGEPDIKYNPDQIIIDIKNAWDFTTFCKKTSMDEDHKYQGLGYCRLTGFRKFGVAYTLVNTPEHLILDEFRREYYNRGMIDLNDNDKAEIALRMVYSNEWFEVNESGGITKRNDYWDMLKSAHFPDTNIEFLEIPKEKRLRYYEVEFTDEDFAELENVLANALEYIEENFDKI